jgi:hypothetical protein
MEMQWRVAGKLATSTLKLFPVESVTQRKARGALDCY